MATNNLLQLFRAAIPYVTLSEFKAPLSQKLVASMNSSVVDEQAQRALCCIGSNVWSALVVSKELISVIDPEIRHAMILDGRLGTLLGMDLMTDGYCHLDDRFVPVDALYVMSVTPQDKGFKCVGITV